MKNEKLKKVEQVELNIGGKVVPLKQGVYLACERVAGTLKSIEEAFDFIDNDDGGKLKTKYRICVETYITLDEIRYVSFEDKNKAELNLYREDLATMISEKKA